MNVKRADTAELLVLAPEFPSINQPWMDTYLEQLQKTGINYEIATYVARPDIYQEKVDRLGLLEHATSISSNNKQAVLNFIYLLTRKPISTFSKSKKLWNSSACERSPKTRVAMTLRSLLIEGHLRIMPAIRLCHSHSLSMAYEVLPILKSNAIPMVITFHGLEPSGVPQVADFRRKAIFDYAKKILVNTEFARNQARKLGADEGKIVVIPQGISLEQFGFIHRKPPSDQETLNILTIGRLSRDKGQAYALLALRRALDQGRDVHWHFVGLGLDEARLKKLVMRLGIEDRVTFHGALSFKRLQPLFQLCPIFVLPSLGSKSDSQWAETQGVVLQEAQATGCVPIATRVGGVPECINDHVDGLLIKDRSYRAISSALEYLLSDPVRWHSMHLKGRENVEARFSADFIGKRMAEILRLEIQNGSR